MAVIERDVVLRGKSLDGSETIDLPLTRLGHIEDTAEVKPTPSDSDFIAIIDSSAKNQMKKIQVSALAAYFSGGVNAAAHINNTQNPHGVTKAQVGLSNVDNTSDADKPVSTATLTALNAKANLNHTHNYAAKPVCVTVSLASSGWSGSGPFAQSVNVSGVLADPSKQIIIPAPSPSSWEAAGSAGVFCSAQSANSLTFTAKNKPEDNLTYYVAIQGVQ